MTASSKYTAMVTRSDKHCFDNQTTADGMYPVANLADIILQFIVYNLFANVFFLAHLAYIIAQKGSIESQVY